MKNNRQNAILKIITEHDVDTQEELISRLADCGFSVTQATVSRDIREMKLVKAASSDGGYRYVAPESKEEKGSKIYYAAFSASIRSVEAACNLVVIKTYPGLANAVAANIDSLGDIDIVGCIAGDDTVFVATRSAKSAEEVAAAVRSLIKA